MIEATCACGAVGRVLPPDFAYGPRSAERPEMIWRGGRVGVGRMVIEDARSAISACPACQHRASVTMISQ